MILYIDDEIKPFFSTKTSLFTQIMSLKGECFRHQKGRITQKITLGGKHYFLKTHQGVGFQEIIKNLLQLRLPIISAKNEWQAILKLNSLNIAVPRVLAYGERGLNPAKRESFILLEELTKVISLEELVLDWQKNPPSFSLKQALIKEVAHIAAHLHRHGMNHRDFYLCHFLLSLPFDKDHPKDKMKLFLIDLHRASIRSLTPERWIIKDLGGLYFSSKAVLLSQRDLYRFMKYYHGLSLRELFNTKKLFWQKVNARGNSYRDRTV